jgi:hypothetical protein
MRSISPSCESVDPGAPMRPGPCTAIVTITGGRPEALSRCLRALRTRASHGAARLLVLDRDPAGSGWFPGGLSLRPDDRYLFSRPTRERLVTHLAAHGIEPSVARFAVGGWSESSFDPGANRNTLLLLTAGECLVSVDDDVIPAALVPRTARARLTFQGEGEPRDSWFDRGERSLTASGQTLVEAIETMLGRELDSLVDTPSGDLESRGTRPDRVRDGYVRAVVPGLVGDHALMAASVLLVQSASSMRRLSETEAGYHAAVTRRHILRCVEGPAISQGPAFMTTCYGYANTNCGVPFSPNYANEDALFGAMLRLADPRAYTGYIPEVVRHAPIETRTFAFESVREPVPLRITHVLAELLRGLPVTADTVDPEAWCQRAGDALVHLSLEPPAAFGHRIAAAVEGIWARDLSRVAAVLDGQPGWSPWLERDLRGLMSAIVRDRSRPLDHQIRDCEGLASAQRYIGEFGRLVTRWPRMWTLLASLSIADKSSLVGTSPGAADVGEHS